MRRLTTVIVGATLAAAAPAAAQAPLRSDDVPSPLSVDVRLGDYGLDYVREVVRGRVSVVLAADRPRLELHFLRADESDGPGQPPEPASHADSAAGGASGVTPPLSRGAHTAVAAPAEPLVALWVWGTADLLADATARSTFLDFVREQRIARVFLQLVPARDLSSSAGFVPFDGASLGPLVAELRTRGALTYALDGDPRYALPEIHDGVVRTVERVVEHNRRAPPEERFHGVRYDVEPYLLPGFQSPAREGILEGYLRLVERVATAAREGGLAVGVDIPFWLDGPDEVTGRPFQIERGGVSTPVLRRVLELVDDVAVMAYRTVAEGPDGVLTHAAGELSRAGDLGVEVFVGVETTPLLDEMRHTFRGAGRAGLPDDPEVAWVVVQALPGGRARVWLVEGREALDVLARTADPAASTYWFAGLPVRLEADRLSFHDLGAESLRRATDEIVRGFADAPAFRGLAYHDYVGLKRLLDGG